MVSEKRLIDANALCYEIDCCSFETSSDYMTVCEQIAEAPTVDAVEVVRCKDCQHWKNSWCCPEVKESHGYCHLEDADNVIVGRWESDFCSYGERRTNV